MGFICNKVVLQAFCIGNWDGTPMMENQMSKNMGMRWKRKNCSGLYTLLRSRVIYSNDCEELWGPVVITNWL